MKQRLFNSVLGRIKPSEKEICRIKRLTSELKEKLKGSLKKQHVDADVFIGGSLAKNTIIRKGRYDIDIFVRFDYKKYVEKDSNLSDILEKILKRDKLKYQRIHGSRDYFHLLAKTKIPILFEIVPVLKIKKPEEARNVTDLSYFHSQYVLKKLKVNEKLADEIRLMKAFCHAQRCYGAESHIKGFSGYAIELLVLHFGSFMNLINAAKKWLEQRKKDEKIIIDIARHYKSKHDVMLEINEAKLISPIVLVDPTYTARNVAASVSDETFEKFINACKAFGAKPSSKFFEKKEIDAAKLRKIAKKRKANFSILSAEAKKDKEDIAAAKLSKFFDFFVYLMNRNGFEVLYKEIEFKKNHCSTYIIYKKPSAEVVVAGPPINVVEHLLKFKKKHKNVFVKNGRVFARIKREARTINDILNVIKKGTEMKDMSIKNLRLVK